MFLSAFYTLPLLLGATRWELDAFLGGENGGVPQALRWNRALHYSPEFISRIQGILGCRKTGRFDRETVIALARFQSRNWAHVNGRLTLFTRYKMKIADFRKTIRRERHVSAGAGLRKDVNTPIVYTPSGWKKTLYFLFGYRTRAGADQRAKKNEYAFLLPNMAYAFARGMRVVYRPFATVADFSRALRDPTGAGIIWSGHGYAYGVLQDAAGSFFAPLAPGSAHGAALKRHLYGAYRHFRYRALGGKTVRARLSFLVLASCRGKRMEGAWKQLLGEDPVLVSWKPRISVTQSMFFYSIHSEKPRLLDLIQGVLRKEGQGSR